MNQATNTSEQHQCEACGKSLADSNHRVHYLNAVVCKQCADKEEIRRKQPSFWNILKSNPRYMNALFPTEDSDRDT